MSNSFTNYGQDVALWNDAAGTGTNKGGIAQVAAFLKLYKSTSVPAKDGTGFVECDAGNGYTLGGQAVVVADWTRALVSGNMQIQLADKTWTATGGSITGIAGAYLTDANGKPLIWWERTTPLTLNDGDSITADDLIIRIV